jgi:hypothetical protein
LVVGKGNPKIESEPQYLIAISGNGMLVTNPAKGHSVSLRATAVGKGGDPVTQSIIDAYLTR